MAAYAANLPHCVSRHKTKLNAKKRKKTLEIEKKKELPM